MAVVTGSSGLPAGASPPHAVNGAVEAAATETTDPHVSVAFALGWQMAEMYRPGRRYSRHPAAPDDLPGVGSLTPAELVELGLHQVEAALAKLKGPITDAGQDPAVIQSVLQALRTARDDAVRHSTVLRLHVELLCRLTAADFRIGKAYGLGRALADTCRNPETLEDLQREFKRERIANVGGWIADLSSSFPPHAGHSVRQSLNRWADAVEANPDLVIAHLTKLLPLLRRQGTLWRSLLSGEKLGKDALELSNYVRAAESVIVRMRGLAFHFVSRFRLAVVLTVALFAVGVALVAISSSATSVVAGIGTILASFGLTWKGVGGSLGRAAAKIEQPVWSAQLDIAIADAITLLPDEVAAHRGQAPGLGARVRRELVGGSPSAAPPATP